MNRRILVIFAGLTISAAVAVAGHPVMTHEGVILEGAQTAIADNGAIWVRAGLAVPLEVTPDPQGEIHLPPLAAANYVVLDAASGQPVTEGSISWLTPGAPEVLTRSTWNTNDGRLDFSCRGDEKVLFSAPGYGPSSVRLVADGRRHTVLLQPLAALTIELDPAIEAWMWLAREDRINVTNLFVNVAEKHRISADGVIELPDLDRETSYVGIVVAQGMAPVHGSFQKLPQNMSLSLEEGIAVSGTVKDNDGNPIPGARIEALGEIAELDNFRYRQKVVCTEDGSFSVSGMLPGEVRVRACADRRACSEKAIVLAADNPAEPVNLELSPGRDLVLVVENQVRDRVGKAMVYFNDRLHYTDHRGELRVEGVTNRETIPVTIFGSGFGMWEGSFTADRDRVVITVPGGAVIEQQVLSAARFDEHEVTVRWQQYTESGREGKSGKGRWDSERGIARAEGLEAGTYALSVRLPRSATLVSERVEIASGEELVLPAVVPDRGLAISGRVLDAETLQPVPGAQVSCEPGTPTVFRAPHVVENVPSVLTDTDGVFLLEGLDPGTCRAIVRAAGFATWRLDGVEPDEIGFDIGDVEVDAGMTVVGRVYDRMDRPITGAVVEITEAAAYAYFAEATVRTDHDGYFRAERLPVGRWKLSATHGQETARETVEGEAWETVEVDLMLGGISVEGEVWLGDERAAGGTLILTTEGAQAPGVVVMMQRVTADRQFFGIDQQPLQFMVSGDGRFAGSGLSPGRYYASYTPAGGASAAITKILDVPHVESFQCAIQYSDAVVEGFVIDTDGQPVAGASVLASAGDGIQDATAFTDADGRFSVQGLEPGRLVLTANHTDFAPSEPSEFELRTGSVEGPVILELLPHDGANIMLSVNTVAGSAGGAPVYLVGPETSTGFTDGGGLATFSGIQAGSYRPCGIAYGGATGCGPNLMVDNGEQVEAHLDLGQGGYVDIYLSDDRDSASSTTKGMVMAAAKRGPSVRVMTADGVDLSSLLFMANPPQPTAGGLRIGPLQADDYIISVGTASGPLQGQVTVVDGAPTELDLR
jgi:protocatechuate 3,4-dioxygenase beta subunit